MVTPPYYLVQAGWESKLYWQHQDVDTPHGRVKKEEIQQAENGGIIKSLERETIVYEATVSDVIRHFQRGAQLVTLKDAAYIAYRTGMKDGIILDAGTGSGGSAAAYSLLAKHVYTFEPREAHARIAEKNFQKLRRLGYGENITLIQKPVEAIREGDFPRFTHAFLDLPEAGGKALSIHPHLAPGAWMIIYTPHVTQQNPLHEELRGYYQHVETFELPKRSWQVTTRKARPEKTVLHTAFISIWLKKS